MKTIENADTLQLDTFLQSQISSRKTPGLYYALFNAKQILHEFSGGKADVKNQIPVDAQTVFYGYSVTKTFKGDFTLVTRAGVAVFTANSGFTRKGASAAS